MKTYCVTYADNGGFYDHLRINVSADTIYSCIVKAGELLNMINKMDQNISYEISEITLLED